MVAHETSSQGHQGPDAGKTTTQNVKDESESTVVHLANSALDFAKQSEKLSHQQPEEGKADDVAIEAKFITPHDPVIVTSQGHRLPGVPLVEAHKLNILKEEIENNGSPVSVPVKEEEDKAEMKAEAAETEKAEKEHQASKGIDISTKTNGHSVQKSAEGSLRRQMPPSHTNPLFPPLPLYGPPSILRNIQVYTFRVSSFFLSLAFLGVIVLGALFTSLPPFCVRIWALVTGGNPDTSRPFYEEEEKRKRERKELARQFKRRRSQEQLHDEDNEDPTDERDGFVPTEGGDDPIKCDVAYYARRVGLDVEEFHVQTEDGFIIELWHVYDPREYTRIPEKERADRGPELFKGKRSQKQLKDNPTQKPKFPVLLMHGLLQSAGAYCVNDDDSLAFYLCKSGYDVWLGNNRCGFNPRHVLLEYADPRMWCWNIRQMGVFDLPALTSRVLTETGFDKIGLIAHSQGTTQTLVSLAKGQRPELGEKLTVFCALAPAAYAGPLIGKMYFKFMRVITPAMFRMMFGIHAFIPFMMTMHKILHPRLYGWLGYKVFSFLFNWTDTRWDRDLKDRMFQFAPVYVSAESMRWWLGRECFAKHKCILSTKEERIAEEQMDMSSGDSDSDERDSSPGEDADQKQVREKKLRGKRPSAWYNEKVPPLALWVCGNDDLVDGRKLLRRFEKGREPHVQVVHSKVIPEYEHLDVIWAMDAVDQVFKEVRETLWKTCNTRDLCRVPRGCEDIGPWEPKDRPSSGKREDSGFDEKADVKSSIEDMST